MTRYERVQQILDNAIGGPNAPIGVHGAFWRGLTRDQFIVKRIRGLVLVTLGDGANSTIIHALKGEAPFGADLDNPQGGAFISRMPAGLPPVPDADIAFIQKWIDEQAPEDEFKPDAVVKFAWRLTKAPVASSRTDDIFFLNPTTGWAVNSNGQIIHTADGGDTWTVQLQTSENDRIYFRCIGLANPQRGWAGTLHEVFRLFETSDGSTWRLISNLPDLAPSAICGISVVSDQVVYGSGTNFPNRPARMLKTVDGGKTWTAWEMAEWADLLVDCFFTDATHGWVVGGKSDARPATRLNVKPVVLQTDDGGATWTNRVAGLDFPAGEWGWKIFFLNARVGFVCLENFSAGAILKTTDGGQTWIRLPVNDPQRNANLEGIGFIDEQTGWVGGWGDSDFEKLFSSATTDGGMTWSNANEIGKALNRFRFFGTPVTVGYASGLTVYKYERVSDGGARLREVSALAAPREVPVQVRRTLTSGGINLPLGRVNVGDRVAVTIFGRFGDEVAFFESPAAEAPGGPVLYWDLRDAQGRPVEAGHYIVRFNAKDEVWSCLLKLSAIGAAEPYR